MTRHVWIGDIYLIVFIILNYEEGQVPTLSVRKIMLIDTAGFGGISQYTCSLARALCRLSVEIVILTTKHPEWPVHDLPCGIMPVFGGHARFRFRILKGISYLHALFLIAYNLVKTRPHLLHLQESKFPAGERVLFTICRILGVRTVMTLHDLHVINRKNRTAIAKLLRKCDGVIVHSEQNRTTFKEMFGNKDICEAEVIQHGNYNHLAEPVSRNDARRRLGIEEEINLILFFGYLRHYKGIDILLDAVPEIVRKNNGVRVLIAGKPAEPAEPYAATIRELGIEHYVTLMTEYVPAEDVKYYFSSADVVVLPYRDVTQSGLIYLAYAYRKPVIASAVGGIPELVKNGETGLLVPPGQPDLLADAIAFMLSDAARAAAFGEAGYKYMEDKFGWAAIGVKTKMLYDRLLS